MDIFYTNETLYVNMKEQLTSASVDTMQRRVFRIVEDYDIDNVVLNVVNFGRGDRTLIEPFVDAYNKKHNGNLKIM